MHLADGEAHPETSATRRCAVRRRADEIMPYRCKNLIAARS